MYKMSMGLDVWQSDRHPPHVDTWNTIVRRLCVSFFRRKSDNDGIFFVVNEEDKDRDKVTATQTKAWGSFCCWH